MLDPAAEQTCTLCNALKPATEFEFDAYLATGRRVGLPLLISIHTCISSAVTLIYEDLFRACFAHAQIGMRSQAYGSCQVFTCLVTMQCPVTARPTCRASQPLPIAWVCAVMDVQRVDVTHAVPQNQCKKCVYLQRKKGQAESGARATAIRQVGSQSKPAHSLFIRRRCMQHCCHTPGLSISWLKRQPIL